MSLTTIDGIGVMTIDSPPVNALGSGVRNALLNALRVFAADERVRAILIIGTGRTFSAGADIAEFGKPPLQPDLRAVLALIEASRKPIVAAIHGTALGGGLELALACNYRIAVPSAKVGLPEVNLGLLPGAGGTQRLPRLIGPELALDLILSGRPVPAATALEYGIVDRLAEEGHLQRDAIAFASSVADKPLVRVRDREDKIEPYRGKSELFNAVRQRNARVARGFKAPDAIVEAVQAAVNLAFDEGLERERVLFAELHDSRESAAQRYCFFAERKADKIPDIPAGTAVLPIKSVGIIGAGTMGGGITMNFLNVGIPVTLVETTREALDRGLGVIRRNYENSAAKGRITQAQIETRMALITPALDLKALVDVDLVIEAVFEEMAIKKDIFKKLDAICRPGTILASNTSFLDVNEIASVTSRPEWVLGLHFFSPANVMRLLEVVRGARTSKEIVATAMALAKKIGKVAVLSGICHGFIANRVMATRTVQADAVILEGTAPIEVDRAICEYGFAMGPFQMADLVGLDVIGRGTGERTVRGDLVKLGRLGQKKDGGYYDYDEKRNGTPSPVAAKVIADLTRLQGIAARPSLSPPQIIARLLYPVVNEGAKLLEEGIALRASDIDIAVILGYNWPVYTGGPMFWADGIGLSKIVAELDALRETFGDMFEPSSLLRRYAKEGRRLTDD